MVQAPLLDLRRIPLASEDDEIHALPKCNQLKGECGQEIRSPQKSQEKTGIIDYVAAARDDAEG